MSFIGPRPQTKKFFECFDNEDAKIIATVRPGLSGIGSIVFRDEEEIFKTVDDPQYWDEEVIMPYKGKLECWYIKNMSMKNYFLLIVATVMSVLFPRSINVTSIFKDLPPPSKELELKLRELK